jgi:uncharacterized protein involved in type VI secretion and phage assembly
MKPPIQQHPHPAAARFYGKYRGIVVNNIDPQQIGRMQLQVPAVLGASTSAWALPCMPVAGPQMGLFVLPPVGANVWVEFEGGDPDAPIWVGGFWTSPGDLPPLAQASSASGSRFVIETPAQNGLAISDQPGPSGGIVLKSSNGATLIINDSGIHLQNGQGASIDLAGPEVSVNRGALAVI